MIKLARHLNHGLCLILLACQTLVALPGQAEPVSFVYVHGVNNHQLTGDEVVRRRFEKLHTAILDNLNQDAAAQEILTQSDRYAIEKKPSIFYWGNINQNSIHSLRQELNFFKKNQSRIAAFLQSEVATVIQDFFWLVRQSNQNKIMTALDRHIEEDVPDDHSLVLYAHSGGAIIAFQYMLHYLPYLDINHYIAGDTTIPDEVKQQATELGLHPTCLNALLASQLVHFDSQGEMTTYLASSQGKHLTESDWIEFIDKLEYLQQQTSDVCVPQSRIRGLVTFGNPMFALLPMDKDEPGMEAQLNRLLLRYMLENGIFWLNLNRINDPVGYSISNEQIMNSLRSDSRVNTTAPNTGFIYNNVDTSGRIYFFKAHSSYLNRPEAFSRFIVDSLKEGAKQGTEQALEELQEQADPKPSEISPSELPANGLSRQPALPLSLTQPMN